MNDDDMVELEMACFKVHTVNNRRRHKSVKWLIDLGLICNLQSYQGQHTVGASRYAFKLNIVTGAVFDPLKSRLMSR